MARIVSWNVNSLNARQERVQQWLADIAPDVLCMQETKLGDEAFPAMAFAAAGYDSAHHGQGRWNGVAILSRVGLDDVVCGFADGIEPDPDARLITARCGGVVVVNGYIPNGRALDDPHYQYKLSWLDRLDAHLDAVTTADDDVIVVGDFNIAPADIDVYDPKAFVGSTHTSAAERAALARLEARGLVDVFRHRYPDAPKLYSWWDYRRGDFHQGRGLRIDLALASPALAARVEWCIVDRNARKGELPSDHAPLVVDVAA